MKRWLAAVLLLCLLIPAFVSGNAPRMPAITLIIDDLGDRLPEGWRVVELPGPVVAALLPDTPHARELAKAARRAGKEVLIHMPMQAINGADPGPGALTLDMDEQQFHDVVQRALTTVPGASGMNNHMGSLITQHPGHMAWLMAMLRDHDSDMVFVDSRTTSRSVATAIARENGVAHVQRDVFLDHDPDPASIRRELHRLLARARRDGTAIGIGHPYPQTLDVLEEELPRLAADFGVELISLRDLMERRQ
ncbi:MAG: divergent polysaccharide deacetylase family protein [Aquisalimonadaceae bacterium]